MRSRVGSSTPNADANVGTVTGTAFGASHDCAASALNAGYPSAAHARVRVTVLSLQTSNSGDVGPRLGRERHRTQSSKRQYSKQDFRNQAILRRWDVSKRKAAPKVQNKFVKCLDALQPAACGVIGQAIKPASVNDQPPYTTISRVARPRL